MTSIRISDIWLRAFSITANSGPLSAPNIRSPNITAGWSRPPATGCWSSSRAWLMRYAAPSKCSGGWWSATRRSRGTVTETRGGPGDGDYLKRDRGFESGSLQRGVSCEPNFLEAGAEEFRRSCSRARSATTIKSALGACPGNSKKRSGQGASSSIRWTV
jgi:hypothetical protein